MDPVEGGTPVSETRPPAPRSALLPWVFAAASFLAAWMAVDSGLSFRTHPGGPLSLALPAVGALFYAGLALLARFRPDSPWLARALALYSFAHADLVTERILEGRLCWLCFAVAGWAGAAALIQVRRDRALQVTMAAGLLFGAAAGFFAPFERADDAATRALWPSKLFEAAPAFVDRREMEGCEHAAPVRLIVYEKDCKSCGSVLRRIEPRLKADFPGELCVHAHSFPEAPPGQRLPLFVLVTKRKDVIVIEGMPSYDDLRGYLQRLLGRAPSR